MTNASKDYILLSHLRNNARSSLTTISKATSIPISTIFDRLRHFEKVYIAKHTCLLNFQKLGFDIKTHILFRLPKEQKEAFARFLMAHPRINSIWRTSNNFDYLVEGVFTSMQELDVFLKKTEDYRIENRAEYFIVEDVAREAVLSNNSGFASMVVPTLPKI